jgi:hypothetical protein
MEVIEVIRHMEKDVGGLRYVILRSNPEVASAVLHDRLANHCGGGEVGVMNFR